MPRVMPRASMTSSTGRPSRRASAALLLLPSSARPSYRPLLPSTSASSAPCSAVGKAAHERRVVHQVGVEVEAGPAGGAAEPHRVDVVRPLLERLHHRAARGQRRAQAERDRGLARRLVCGGDEQGAVASSRAWARRASSAAGSRARARRPGSSGTPRRGRRRRAAVQAATARSASPRRRRRCCSPRGPGRCRAGTPGRR